MMNISGRGKALHLGFFHVVITFLLEVLKISMLFVFFNNPCPPGSVSPPGATAPSTTEGFLLVFHIEDYTYS